MVSDENLPNVNKTKQPKKGGEKGKWSITIDVGCAYDLHSCSNSSLSCLSTGSRKRPSCKSVSFALYICGHTVSCWQSQNLTNPVFFLLNESTVTSTVCILLYHTMDWQFQACLDTLHYKKKHLAKHYAVLACKFQGWRRWSCVPSCRNLISIVKAYQEKPTFTLIVSHFTNWGYLL